ncbi:vacuolar protein sorting-associated protein 8 homolog isoform X2 [Nematostella vectensis]|nr:vacuolar protein sorting-associated protein 8 homolog isoform X2 [Nematostella vectensis]
MWDLQSGKLLRTILDAHPIGSAVLHVRFTDDPTVAFCSYSGGSVFVLSFKRLIGVRSYESTCLFSGSRGEVCTLAPLHMHQGMKDHPMYEFSMLALATLTKVLVLTLKPTMEVLFTHRLQGPSDSLPLLSWQFAIIQVASHKVIDPVLAFGRGGCIYFYQAHCRSEKDVKFMFLQRVEVDYKLIALNWLNPHVMAAIDSLERLHVLDVRSMEELEIVDLSSVQLVYSSSYFKSLSTGGNVSKALVAASEHACYQTIAVFNGQMLVLGRKAIHVLTMRTWTDRLSLLVRLNRFTEALDLALSFYNGTAKAVVGLVGSIESRRYQVATEMEELLVAYADIVVFNNCPKSGERTLQIKYFEDTVPVFIHYTLAIQKTDLLFRDIYYKFCEDSIGKTVFLECLQPYILSDRLTSLSPIVMKDFIEHYQEMGRLKEVEACLLHLDVMNLDIHQMVKLCWSHCLYDAILYVYNRGMRDYTTPLEELLAVLKSSINSDKPLNDTDQALGYRLLVYISCCLAGRAYPVGEIQQDIVTQVKSQVFNCVTAANTRDAFETESPYPYVRTLLQFNTQEFLNVLSMAFEENEFDQDFRRPSGVAGRQYVVNILLEVMVQGTGFSPKQVGSLFTFLARQLAKHDSFQVDKILFEQVLEYLANPDDDSRHEERQQALLELLAAGGLNHFDDERILVLAENAKFYRVCELLYEKTRQFPKILSCYLRDPARREQAFLYIHTAMTDDAYTDLEREEVKAAALDALQELVSVSCTMSANLIIFDFPDTLVTVVARLETNPSVQYEFLKGVFDGRTLMSKPEFSPDANIHERYIELMCNYETDEIVYNYLRTADNYRIEETLSMVRGRGLTYATAYLLEKAGDVQGAFQLLLEKLKEKVMKNVEAFEKSRSFNEVRICSTELWSVMVVITQLCQRNSARMDESDREALWFPLLETVMAPQRKWKDTSSEEFKAFKDLTRHVMNGMMGYIALPAILQKIMQDPTYSTRKFGEIKELILGMLNTYNYESTLLKTTNQLLAKDLHSSMSALRSNRNRGLAPVSTVCGMCHHSSSSDARKTGKVAILRCGHMFHTECLTGTSDVTTTVICPFCQHSNQSSRKSAPSRFNRHGGASGDMGSRPDKSQGLSSQQFENISRFRRLNKTPSRLAILSELSRSRDDGAITLNYGSRSQYSRSIFQDENFKLQLAPPPIPKER